MSIDLALIFPRLKYPSGDPPLGLASIAALCREKGFSVEIVDATWHPSVRWVVDEINGLQPRVIGIYCSTLMLPAVKGICEELKGANIVVGGPHPSICPEDFFGWGNVTVVQGEGELTMVNILSGVQGDMVICNASLPYYPPPALDLLDMEKYIERWHYLDAIGIFRGTNLVGSRGCPFSCQFCQPTLELIFGKRVRKRKPEQIAEEMADLSERYNLNAFFFHDDTFTAYPKWLTRFLTEVSDLYFHPLWGCNSRVDTVTPQMLKDMYAAGCRMIHFGIESGSQRILDDVYDKRIKLEQVHAAVNWAKDVGILPSGFFMLGAPDETKQEMDATVDLACSLPLSEASFSLVVPLPGTRLWDRMMAKGYTMSADVNQYDYYAAQPFSGDFDRGWLRNFQRKALIRFYMSRPKYMLHHFTSAAGVKRLASKVRRFI